MNNILKYIILLLLSVLDRGMEQEEKIVRSSILDGIDVMSEQGWSPAAYIHITKPFEIWTIQTDTGKSLSCADNHLVFTLDLYGNIEPVSVSALKIGDRVVTSDRTFETVIHITKSSKKVCMCDLTVLNENESYYTNGILSHNTTTSAIFMLHYILFNIDKNALVLGNKRKTAVEILTKLKKIFQELPYFLKPGVYKWNEGEINLDNGCMCMAEATTINSGISFTFHCVLADEFAHIHPNILDKFYNNLFPVVTAGKARFIISSTQNGYNLFYRLWCGAVEHENEYMPFKVDWWQVPEWDPDKQCFVKRDEKWHKLQIANYGGEQAFNKQFGTGFDISGNSLISSKALNRLAPRTVEFKRQEMKCRGADYFFWNLESDVTLDNLREHYVTLTVDISEASGGDYIVCPINVLRTGVFGEDLDSLRGEVKTECVGYFYTNEHGYKWAAEILREFCMTYLYQPGEPRYIISVELNLYGELFVNYMKTIIDRDTMTVQFFSEDAFVKYYNDSMTKYEFGARITPSTKQKYCKLFKSDIEDGKIVCCATKFHNELTNFCDQKGNGTYKASFGHDDFVMAQIQLEAVFKTVQWKNFVEDFFAYEETKKMKSANANSGQRPNIFSLGSTEQMPSSDNLYSFGYDAGTIQDPYFGANSADMQNDPYSNLSRLRRMM